MIGTFTTGRTFIYLHLSSRHELPLQAAKTTQAERGALWLVRGMRSLLMRMQRLTNTLPLQLRLLTSTLATFIAAECYHEQDAAISLQVHGTHRPDHRCVYRGGVHVRVRVCPCLGQTRGRYGLGWISD